jgi:carbon storage regulator
MLVLSRKKNESIMIGEDIEPTILEIHGDQVKVGIKAPKDVEILRKEIILKIEDENKKAIQGKVNFEKFFKKID